MAMPPAATLSHRIDDAAVGLAANGRKAAGSTPSTLTNTPLTLTRPAATGTAATTPARRRRLRRTEAGSEVGSTTSMSAGSSLTGLGTALLTEAGSGLATTAAAVSAMDRWRVDVAPREPTPGIAPTDWLTPVGVGVARPCPAADLAWPDPPSVSCERECLSNPASTRLSTRMKATTGSSRRARPRNLVPFRLGRFQSLLGLCPAQPFGRKPPSSNQHTCLPI